MSIGSLKWLLIFLSTLTRVISKLNSYIPLYSCYGENYTSDSMFKKNTDTALSSLISTTSNWGYYNSSIGQEPDKVNVLAMCRGDVEPDICQTCVNYSISDLTSHCPYQKDAGVWYEKCMLRYSNRSIFHTLDPLYPYVYYLEDPYINSSKVDEFNKAVGTLLDKLRSTAITGGSQHKFAADHITGPDLSVIYGLLQCTPDLSSEQCDDCLIASSGYITRTCSGRARVYHILPNCIIRYSDERFFNLTTGSTDSVPDAPPPSPPISISGPANNSDHNTISDYLRGLGSGILLILVIVCFSILIGIRIKKKKVLEKFESVNENSGWESMQVDFGAIKVGTANFSETNRLGQGGFGRVYMGVLRNGQRIAVKRLSRDSSQGEQEFRSEVSLLAKLQHRNLVRLLGFCLRGKERLLVYEFVPNSSLDHFIFDSLKRVDLDWNSRKKIISGIARGLLYLHVDSRLRIIHRDLKPSNILLDAEMNPKISDFGLARLFSIKETHANTKRIVGTSGYMAPEYVKNGEFSVKSDVFSFGIIVLEILIRRKSNEIQNEEDGADILSMAWKIWEEGSNSNLIELSLGREPESVQEMMRCIQIGLLCTQEKIERPTIDLAYRMLTCSSFTIPVPQKPHLLTNTTIVDSKISDLQNNCNPMNGSY